MSLGVFVEYLDILESYLNQARKLLELSLAIISSITLVSMNQYLGYLTLDIINQDAID